MIIKKTDILSDQLIHENQINLLRDSLNKKFSFNKKDKYQKVN